MESKSINLPNDRSNHIVWFQKISIPLPQKVFWFASPHPLGISVPRGSLMTPLPPGISTLREHGFGCNIYYYSIHFQHITLCYCSILFACLLSGLKCSMFFTKICLNRVLNVLSTLVPRVAANNLHAECDVNNEAKILRIEIVFATLKPAIKSETVECKLH